jgi:hypothetical protein
VAVVLGGGATIWWVRLWFWILARERRDRASAVACYGAVWLWMFGWLIAIDVGLWTTTPLLERLSDAEKMWIAIIVQVMHVVALIGIWVDVLKMLHRATRRGWMANSVAAVGIPLGGATVFGVVAFVANYLMGLLGLMWASLRG